MDLHEFILNNKILLPIALKINKLLRDKKLYQMTKSAILASTDNAQRIFYLGIPAHSNLGDLAQGVCIRRWINKHYPNYKLVEIETNALVNTKKSVLNILKANYRSDDFIIFQSGYTTTDLGGFADEMHRAVMGALPNARMLMLPQTIFFEKEENRIRTSKCYNAMKHMLFLARDGVSYDMAKELFPDIPVMKYPDIVTTLIGSHQYDYERNGIMFCCRNDGEKYYSDEQIHNLMIRCSKFSKVQKTDTTKKGKTKEIVRNAEHLIYKEIDTYAHHKVVITDRYHGTILSLVAGTPVIIIKTTDHKVTTGAEWFRGIYDDYVYLADDLEEAYQLAQEVYNKDMDGRLDTYFDAEYYDKLPKIFDTEVQ
ncbi:MULTISPECIES: polysaccharide pyruvyl transferase family protein [Blautia]|uniref:polysaccharide pyruvyl transferase family protein n=1 Tax=Blautia TaxID=572511 RepID=UPI000BA48FED|nr:MULTISPECIES: polysaccharide pyruvyl transferase family protein [Blautia]